jgi:hypothetical protein
MKKYSKISWGFLAVSALVLAGCGCKNNQSTPNGQSPSAGGGETKSLSETVKQSLYDMVTTGAGMKCTLDDPKMGQMIMSVKGNKARVEGFSFMPVSSFTTPPQDGQPPKEEKGTMINDGTWAYMWSGTEGMKFNIEEMKNLVPKNQDQNQGNSQTSASDWKDWIKQMDEKGTKYDCSPTTLSDADFTPPSNVKFEDWGEMMKGFVKMGQDLKDKVPSSTPSPLP